MPEHHTDDTAEGSGAQGGAAGPGPDPLAGLRLDDPVWSRRLEQLVAIGRASPALAVGGVLVAVVAVAVVGWSVWTGRADRAPIEATLPTAPVSVAPPSDSSTSEPAGPVVAHAAGAVAAPGVYELPVGSRVADLIDAAGGLLPDADGDRLNLAGLVVDGSRVYVPRVGEEITPEPTGSSDGEVPSTGGDGGGRADGLVDINRADVDELDTLPGVGPATAEAIVDHRRQHGRFARVDDLIDVRGIGEAKLAQLRDLVTV